MIDFVWQVDGIAGASTTANGLAILVLGQESTIPSQESLSLTPKTSDLTEVANRKGFYGNCIWHKVPESKIGSFSLVGRLCNKSSIFRHIFLDSLPTKNSGAFGAVCIQCQ